MKDLAIWLGKYVGMTYICTAHLEGYAKHPLTKTEYNNAAHIGKHLHEMAKSKDHLNYKKRWLETSKQLNDNLLALTPTNQPPATVSSTVSPPPYNAEGGSAEMQPTLALYTDNNVQMGDASDEATAKLYREWVCQDSWALSRRGGCKYVKIHTHGP